MSLGLPQHLLAGGMLPLKIRQIREKKPKLPKKPKLHEPYSGSLSPNTETMVFTTSGKEEMIPKGTAWLAQHTEERGHQHPISAEPGRA